MTLNRSGNLRGTSSFVTDFLNRFFTNGATFGGFITTEEESEERIKLIKLGLRDDHVGVNNAHKLGVLPKGSDYKQTTSKMSDMEMGATDDRVRDKILAGFGIPKTIVGLTTEVNRASAESSEYIYAKYTIKPIADDLIEFLNTNVAPLFDRTGKLYFAYDDFIPEDLQNKILMRQTALGNQPYMSVNEVRAQVGLPPVEGGDEVMSNPMLIPIGTPAPAAPQQPQDPKDDPKGDPAPKKAPSRVRSALKRHRLIDEIATKAAEVISAHHDPDAEAHKEFVGRVAEHEKLIADKVRLFNNRQQRDVTQRLKQITKSVKKGSKGIRKGDLLDMDGEVSLLIDFVAPLLGSLLTEQAIAEYLAQKFTNLISGVHE